MKTKRILSLLIMTLITLETGAGFLFAAFSKSDAGTTTAQFLKLGAGARASGMGNVQVGCAEDANAIYWNPAGLRSVEYNSVAFMHVPWAENVNYEWVAWARDMGDIGTVGVGIQYLSYGIIEKTNEVGAKTGTVSPNDTAVSLSYARDLVADRLQAGATLKYIATKLEDRAEAVAVDLGAMYWVPDTDLSLGMTAANMGTGMKFIDQESQLPLTIKFGAAYDITEKWLGAIDLGFPVDNDPNYGLGTEYRLGPFAFRTGYNSRTIDIGGLSGLSFGFGYKYKEFSFDYSFELYDYMGDVHRLSIVWKNFR